METMHDDYICSSSDPHFHGIIKREISTEFRITVDHVLFFSRPSMCFRAKWRQNHAWHSLFPLQTDNDFYYASTPSEKPQLLLKIDPPTPQTRVHVYGTEKAASGKNRTKFYSVGPSGYVGIDGYKDGALLCFMAIQPLALEAALSWYENCHQLDDDENSLESIDVDLKAMVVVYIYLYAFFGVWQTYFSSS